MSEKTSTQSLPRRSGRTFWLDLVTDQFMQSPGDAVNYAFRVISPPMEIGKDIEDLVGALDIRDADPAIDAILRFSFSNDALEWNTNDGSTDLLTVTESPVGYHLGLEFNDRQTFGRFIRFELGLKDGGTVKSARISASVLVKVWGA